MPMIIKDRPMLKACLSKLFFVDEIDILVADFL